MKARLKLFEIQAKMSEKCIVRFADSIPSMILRGKGARAGEMFPIIVLKLHHGKEVRDIFINRFLSFGVANGNVFCGPSYCTSMYIRIELSVVESF